MGRTLGFFSGVGIGAALMYLLDAPPKRWASLAAVWKRLWTDPFLAPDASHVGRSPTSQAFEVHATATVAAPPAEVFAFLSDFENLPCFMSHVRAVQLEPGSVSHARRRLGSNAVIVVRNTTGLSRGFDRRHSERSVPTSSLAHSGRVHMEPEPDGSTQLHVRMAYRPIGAEPDVLTRFFQGDPSRALADDLWRLKRLLESRSRRMPPQPRASVPAKEIP